MKFPEQPIVAQVLTKKITNYCVAEIIIDKLLSNLFLFHKLHST